MEAALQVADDVTEAWVARFVAACHHAVAARGRFVVALAGGGTPLPGYRRLGERLDLPWERLWVTWGDERDVPLDHPDRNERAAREAWLDRVPIPPDQVLGWPRRDAPEAAAAEHATRLSAAFGDPLDIDLALLGLGADAHTASLFPGTGAVTAVGVTTVVRPTADGPARLSLTAAALSRAREAWVLVTGADKRPALQRTLAAGLLGPPHPDADPDALPLLAIRPRERLWLLADPAAAGQGTTDAA
ncbi:MAG: 6-phosphogluconolactonase [Trueperaceae bacterium]